MRYDFICKEHGIFEVRQKMSDEHVAFCPVCGREMRRIYQPVIHYWPDVLWNKDGSKGNPDDLPPVPQDQNWGWHGFGEGRKGGE